MIKIKSRLPPVITTTPPVKLTRIPEEKLLLFHDSQDTNESITSDTVNKVLNNGYSSSSRSSKDSVKVYRLLKSSVEISESGGRSSKDLVRVEKLLKLKSSDEISESSGRLFKDSNEMPEFSDDEYTKDKIVPIKQGQIQTKSKIKKFITSLSNLNPLSKNKITFKLEISLLSSDKSKTKILKESCKKIKVQIKDILKNNFNDDKYNVKLKLKYTFNNNNNNSYTFKPGKFYIMLCDMTNKESFAQLASYNNKSKNNIILVGMRSSIESDNIVKVDDLIRFTNIHEIKNEPIIIQTDKPSIIEGLAKVANKLIKKQIRNNFQF